MPQRFVSVCTLVALLIGMNPLSLAEPIEAATVAAIDPARPYTHPVRRAFRGWHRLPLEASQQAQCPASR